MSTYKIHYKVSVWQEVIIDDVRYSKEEIIKRMKENSMFYAQHSPWELFEIEESNTFYDTEQIMTIEENDGDCTVEVYEDNKIVWTNTDK